MKFYGSKSTDMAKKVSAKNTLPKVNATDAKDEIINAPVKNAADDDEEDMEPDEEEIKPKKSAKAKSSKGSGDEEDEDAADEVDDEWEKTEEEESWDPDFDEFDLPASKTKKAAGTKTKEDDLRPDDDFKEFGLFDDDMGRGSRGGFDDDDDF